MPSGNPPAAPRQADFCRATFSSQQRMIAMTKNLKGIAAAALLLAALNAPCRAEDAATTPPAAAARPHKATPSPHPPTCRVPRSRQSRSIRPRLTSQASRRRAIAGTMRTATIGIMPIGSRSRSSSRTSITTASSGIGSPGSTTERDRKKARKISRDAHRARSFRVNACRAGRGSLPPACACVSGFCSSETPASSRP